MHTEGALAEVAIPEPMHIHWLILFLMVLISNLQSIFCG
jgi:hypothetical protein